MADLTIVYYPEPILRAKGEGVRVFGQPLHALAEDMLVAMRAARGMGLAAPQIGKSLQFFVLNVPDEDTPIELDGKVIADAKTIMPMCMANAEVDILPGEIELLEEGCLSFPGIRGEVPRVERCVVRYRDLDGAPHVMVCGGLLARCIQHEHDHCQGVLFIDRMTVSHRQRAETKIKQLVRSAKA